MTSGRRCGPTNSTLQQRLRPGKDDGGGAGRRGCSDERSPKERMIRKRNYSQGFSRIQFQRRSRFAGAVLAVSLAATPSALAQGIAQQPNSPVPGGGVTPAPQPQLQLPPLPAATPITPNGTVVEDVVARVNDQIITRTEYERSEQQLLQEAHQE